MCVCSAQYGLLLLLLLLYTAYEFSLGDGSPYARTDKTNKNKHIFKLNNTKNTVQIIQNS